MSRLAILIAAAAISVLAQSPGAIDSQAKRLSQQQQRGKDIYFGTEARTARPITAVAGNPLTELTGSLTACVGCHGKDGKGTPEAIISPSEINWEALMKPREHSSGRSRPAYTERLLVRAVSMGIDPAGNELHVVMPHFQITREDMNALISYLKVLGQDTGPSPSDRTPAPANGAARKRDSKRRGAKIPRRIPPASPHL